MLNINALRSNNSMAQLQKKLEQTDSGGSRVDPRIWKPTRGKDDKTECVIAFLPVPFVDYQGAEEGKWSKEDLTPCARIMSHAFQGPKGWYIENSRQTFGERECPVAEWTIPQWAIQKKNNDMALKERLKEMFANEKYFANILVIKDSSKPECEGKVMLFEMSKMYRTQLDKASKPDFDTDPVFDPFDPWTGAQLRIRFVYEERSFGKRKVWVPKDAAQGLTWIQTGKPLGDDAFIEKTWKEEHSIMEYYDPSKFKTYAELKDRFCKVMGLDENYNPVAPGASIGNSAEKFLEKSMESAPAQEAAPSMNMTTSAPAAAATPAPAAAAADPLAQFEALLGKG